MKQLGAYLIILIIIIGSTNITVNQHLCNGELESTSIFGEAQPCEHASSNEDLPPCHKKADKKNCCSTNRFTIESVDWFSFFDSVIEINTDQINSTLVATDINIKTPFLFKKEDFALKKTPIPPFIKEYIFIWDESYLI